MTWRVEILNRSVRAEIESLPADIRARLTRIVDLIETIGLHGVHEPHVKPLGDELWEMRMKGRDGIARTIYVTTHKRRVVILHAFIKKSQKTPRAAIDRALARAKEVT
jgi:phage-related protein